MNASLATNHGRKSETNSTSVAVPTILSAPDQRSASSLKPAVVTPGAGTSREFAALSPPAGVCAESVSPQPEQEIASSGLRVLHCEQVFIFQPLFIVDNERWQPRHCQEGHAAKTLPI